MATQESEGSPSRPNRTRFRLGGPSRAYDPRVHAVRRDIADIDLAEWIFAPHYARADRHSLSASSAMLRSAASDAAEAGSQVLHGEGFAVLDVTGGWAWGYCEKDHYVGYLPAAALGPLIEPSHVISARSAPVFAEASIKSNMLASLPFGGRITGVAQGDFIETASGFVHVRHVAPLPEDPVRIAEMLIGAPYLWGGRGANGVDCSGLVQIALQLAGMSCPRDSDQQRDSLGTAIASDAELRRGDLVFLPGHVGMMLDATRLIHANAFWMAVTIEPLAEVLARAGQSPTAIRRIA